MPIQAALAQVGVAVETTKGTAEANPTFGHGLTDGSILTVDVQQDREERTSGTRVSPAVNRTAVVAGFDFTARAHPASVGMWLYSALGTKTVSGTNPYTHTLTTTSTDLPYLTFFGKQDGTTYKLQTCKTDALEFSWDGNGPLEMKASGMGTSVTYSGATFTIASGGDDTTSDYLRAAGGTFQLDTGSSTPATAKITAGSVKIANGVSEILTSGTITPVDVWAGRQDVEVTFDLVIDDWTDWKKIVTGTGSGTSAGKTPTYGSFSCLFTDNGSTAKTLTLAGSRVAFTADFPSADAGGGYLKLSLTGLAVQPSAGGTPLTATLVNATASY